MWMMVEVLFGKKEGKARARKREKTNNCGEAWSILLIFSSKRCRNC